MAEVRIQGSLAFPQVEPFDSHYYLTGLPQELTPTVYILAATGSFFARAYGADFTYNGLQQIAGGTITRLLIEDRGSVDITGLSFSGARFGELVHSGQDATLKAELFAGADLFVGAERGENLRAYGGADSISAGAGADSADGGQGDDTVSGGAGDDVITDPSGANYLRGDDGADSIAGGADFDDINGNMGNDTASGGLGEDWVVGGKDNDSLSGGDAYDLVYGNLGADTISGDDGADIVRGGQGDDMLLGGSGNDFLSGDRDNDTITGGAGADIFSTHGEAGIDRVTDFSLAEGDRVQLLAGTQYTLAQMGADTVIGMTGGGQMILVNVQLNALTPGWILGA